MTAHRLLKRFVKKHTSLYPIHYNILQFCTTSDIKRPIIHAVIAHLSPIVQRIFIDLTHAFFVWECAFFIIQRKSWMSTLAQHLGMGMCDYGLSRREKSGFEAIESMRMRLRVRNSLKIGSFELINQKLLPSHFVIVWVMGQFCCVIVTNLNGDCF